MTLKKFNSDIKSVLKLVIFSFKKNNIKEIDIINQKKCFLKDRKLLNCKLKFRKNKTIKVVGWVINPNKKNNILKNLALKLK